MLGEAEDAFGDGVAVMVVVEEPAVEMGFAESLLDECEVHVWVSPPGGISCGNILKG